jgi:hypothetical protein
LRAVYLSAATVLALAAGAWAQTPVPVPASVLPAPAPTVVGPVVSGPVVSGAAAGDCCLSKCARTPCTPEVKPVFKTVYATTTREFCVPSCSLFGHFLSKCGLADDCEECGGGETYCKTLLVKKLVPKCEEGCGACKTPAPPPVVVVAPVPVVPVAPVVPTVPAKR